jgi:glutamine synthetase
MIGLEAADAMVLFRSAVKQVCRRHGFHATFMSRPHLANLLSSGWHLHQCLRDAQGGANAFMATDAELSDLGRHYLAGLLDHARAGSLFSTPTINGYKRYQPHSLAPDRVNWGRDNKGAMLRVVGGPGDPGSRIENRIGEPAANPYLYMAAQIVAGMVGVERALEPPPPSETPYDDAAERLPASLMEALAALADDPLYADKLGATLVDYLVKMKQAEIARFLSEVTDWEQREYFENF